MVQSDANNLDSVFDMATTCYLLLLHPIGLLNLCVAPTVPRERVRSSRCVAYANNLVVPKLLAHECRDRIDHSLVLYDYYISVSGARSQPPRGLRLYRAMGGYGWQRGQLGLRFIDWIVNALHASKIVLGSAASRLVSYKVAKSAGSSQGTKPNSGRACCFRLHLFRVMFLAQRWHCGVVYFFSSGLRVRERHQDIESLVN